MPRDRVRITIVVDNSAARPLFSEHGLSFWIETKEGNILLDTGQGEAFPHNLEELSVDPARADILVLSHGHYDHTGGVPLVLDEGRPIEVFHHPDLVQTRYAVRDGKAKPIGIPASSLDALRLWPHNRVHHVTSPVRLTGRVGVAAPIPRVMDYEDAGGPFYLDAKATEPDLIEDDLALWIETDKGLVVLLGCAHAGVVNTLLYLKELTHASRIRAVLGGFHLRDAGRIRMEETIGALLALDPDVIVPCHCTGQDAVRMLQDVLGQTVVPGVAGMALRF